jgi:hypothetical protein
VYALDKDGGGLTAGEREGQQSTCVSGVLQFPAALSATFSSCKCNNCSQRIGPQGLPVISWAQSTAKDRVSVTAVAAGQFPCQVGRASACKEDAEAGRCQHTRMHCVALGGWLQ